jgi:hypothetical protein
MVFQKGHKPYPPRRERRIDPGAALETIDGRTNDARRARSIVSAIAQDRGGIDQLSTGERLLIERIAVLTSIIESNDAELYAGKTIDLPIFVMLQNAQRRALLAVGLKRVPRDVTPNLDDIVREHEQEREAAEKDDTMS